MDSLRRDTLENWTRTNPIIPDGELILVATNKYKAQIYPQCRIGNGSSHFLDLPIGNLQEKNGIVLDPSISSLAEAIAAVDSSVRTPGLQITFMDSPAVWVEYRFISSDIANWSNVNFWELEPKSATYLPSKETPTLLDKVALSESDGAASSLALGDLMANYMDALNKVVVPLVSTVTKAGIATFKINASAETIVTISKGGMFFTDGTGVTASGRTITLAAGVATKLYIKLSTETAYLVIDKGSLITALGDTDILLDSTTNGPRLAGFSFEYLPNTIETINSLNTATLSHRLKGSTAVLADNTALTQFNLTDLSTGNSTMLSINLSDFEGKASLDSFIVVGDMPIEGNLGSLAESIALDILKIRSSNTAMLGTMLAEDIVSVDNAIIGSLDDLPASVTQLNIEGNFDGNLATLLSTLAIDEALEIVTTGALTGDISASTTTTITSVKILSSTGTFSGDIGSIMARLVTLILETTGDLEFSTGTFTATTDTISIRSGAGWTSEMTDLFLIAAAAGISEATGQKLISLLGSCGARTIASDSAVETLETLGFTVRTNP